METATAPPPLIVNWLDKVPPAAVDAEMAVLGSMLLDSQALATATDLLSPNDFYASVNQELFSVMVSLRDHGLAVDMVTLTEELRKRDRLDAIGNAAYLADLVNSMATAAHVEHYAKQVKDASIRRAIINAGTRMVRDGHGDEDTQEVLGKAEKAIFSISARSGQSGAVALKDFVHDMLDEIDKRMVTKRALLGISTGFDRLDAKTAGLQPGQLIILAARPAMGKTSLAMNIVEHVTLRSNLPVLVFSLEMSKEELGFRLFSSMSGVDSHRLRTGMMDATQRGLIMTTAEKAANTSLYIEDKITTLVDLRSEARRIASQCARGGQPLSLIVVDYLQLMTSGHTKESRQLEVGDISRGLKALGRELNVPILALSQLNRKTEEREGGRPMLSDLRDSGCLEQDADIVAFVYREGQYKKRDGMTPDEIEQLLAPTELIIAKQRNGPVGEIQMRFQSRLTRFEEVNEWEEQNTTRGDLQ